MNTTSVVQSSIALGCDESLNVTSTVFAYQSTNPIGSGCSATFSLFDVPGAADAGGSNRSADVATFFVDRLGGDFHLAPNSPALSLGEPGVVTTDFDGRNRADPPDTGAFEAP